jgi:hypothetical protein
MSCRCITRFRGSASKKARTSRSPHCNSQVSALRAHLGFKQARRFLDCSVIRRCGYEDEFFDRGLEVAGVLNLALEFGLGDCPAVVDIFAFALNANVVSIAAAAAKNVDPMLGLTGATIVLSQGIFEDVLKQQPRVPLKRLPVLRTRNRNGTEVGHRILERNSSVIG